MSESKTDASVANTSKESNKALKFIDRIKFFEYKEKNPQNWIKDIPNEDLIKDLIFLNYLIRNDSPRKKEIDGFDVTVSTTMDEEKIINYRPPPHSQKINLLNTVIDNIKKLDNHQDQALLAYYSIQLIHPFMDGNGRTGRLIFELINNQSTQDLANKEISTIIQHKENEDEQKGRKIFNEQVMPVETFKEIIYKEIAKNLFGSDFIDKYDMINIIALSQNLSQKETIPDYLLQKLSEKEKERYLKIMNENDKVFGPRILAFLKTIKDKGNLDEFIYESPYRKELLIIDAESIYNEQKLDANDISQFIKNYAEIKKCFYKEVNDIFINPDKHLINTKSGPTPIKDIFITKPSAHV